jgi:hypothetical protein
MTFRKKRAPMKNTAPALAPKDSGMGHDFSISIDREIKDGSLWGQAPLEPAGFLPVFFI